MEKLLNQIHIPVVKEFMTTNVMAVRPDMNIYEAIMLLVDHRRSGAPVIDNTKSRHLVGMLSERDCLALLTNGAYYDGPGGLVKDYMSHKVLTIDSSKDVFAVADLFQKHNYRRLPIVDGDILVGIVTRGDVLRAGKRVWDSQHAQDPPDPGYLTDGIKSRLHQDGLPQVHKRID